MTKENNKVDINKHEIDINTLFKQNVNDLCSIKELYSKLKEVEERFSQIKYLDSTLAYKLKKDYEKLKKIILDENVQATLSNDIETVKTKLTNDIKTTNLQLTNDIETINSQMDTILSIKMKFKEMQNNALAKAYKKILTNELFSICCYGDSLTYGTDNWSEDKITPATTPIPDGTAHTETRGSKQYPSVLEEKLKLVYGSGKVTVINRGYGGDYVERALSRWLPKTHPAGTDICIMGYGTNDSRSPNCPYAGDVEKFLKYYRELIEIELLNGSAVVLITPPKMRQGDDVNVQSFDLAVQHLAKEYNIPLIIGDELLSNYDVSYMSDKTHPNGKGYEIMGAIIASCFIGNGIFDMVKVADGSSLLTRKQIDSIYFNSDVVKISSQYYDTPQEIELSKGIAIQLTARDKATYSFYAEKELIVIPCLNINYDDSIAKLTLDFGVNQPSKSFTTYPDYKYNVQDRTTSPSTVQYNKANSGSASRIFLKEIIVNNLDKLTISKKGWHSITIEAVENRISFAGLLFLPIEYFEFLSKYGGNIDGAISLTGGINSLDSIIVGDDLTTAYKSIGVKRLLNSKKYRLSCGVVNKTDSGAIGLALNEDGIDTARLDIDKTSVAFNEDNTKDLGKSYFRFKDIYASNGVINTSDRNYKKDIVETTLGLDFVNKLKPVDYKFIENTSNRIHTGLIAQDVEEVLKDNDRAMLIKSNFIDEETGEKKEIYALRYNELIAPLIKSVQELSEKIRLLESK